MPYKIKLVPVPIRPKSLRGSGRRSIQYIYKPRLVNVPASDGSLGTRSQEILKVLIILLVVVLILGWFDLGK